MQVDLSHAAGFSLTLDTETCELIDGPSLRFGRIPRRLGDLKPVLFDADGSDPNTEVYWTFPLLVGGQAAAALEVRGLTFSCVVLPPLTEANTSSKLSHGTVSAFGLKRSAAASLYAPGSP